MIHIPCEVSSDVLENTCVSIPAEYCRIGKLMNKTKAVGQKKEGVNHGQCCVILCPTTCHGSKGPSMKNVFTFLF